MITPNTTSIDKAWRTSSHSHFVAWYCHCCCGCCCSTIVDGGSAGSKSNLRTGSAENLRFFCWPTGSVPVRGSLNLFNLQKKSRKVDPDSKKMSPSQGCSHRDSARNGPIEKFTALTGSISLYLYVLVAFKCCMRCLLFQGGKHLYFPARALGCAVRWFGEPEIEQASA